LKSDVELSDHQWYCVGEVEQDRTAVMLWFFGLVALYILLAVSDSKTGNPLAFIGLAFGGFCFFLLGGVVLKAIGLS
jgi:hypothetical protein